MPDVFISYSKRDAKLAAFVQKQLTEEGLTAFLAPVSLSPGERWSPRILASLRQSEWVILLASKAACRSAFVNQEFGQALAMEKAIVPVVWDMDAGDLPGWMAELQALDLRGDVKLQRLGENLRRIAESVRRRRSVAVLGAIALALLLAWAARKARR